MGENNSQPTVRIAYIVNSFPGISETFVIREIQAMLNRGVHVSIFALRRPDDEWREKSLSNPETESLCSYARPDNLARHLFANIKNFILHPFRYLLTFKLFVSQIFQLEPALFLRMLYHLFCGIGFSDQARKLGITHIHCHFATATNVGLAMSRYSRIPFSFTAHASGDIFVKPILIRQKLEHASFIVAVCEYSRKYLDSITDYRYSGKIFRIYNGIEVSESETLLDSRRGGREGLKRPHNEIRIISVGRLVGCKGYTTLFDSLRILIDRGYRITCQIMGNGPEREILKTMITGRHLEDTIQMNGYAPLKDVYEALGKADIFVLLSEIHVNGYRDGFPTVILEAMLMSLPVVSTWISGIPEMVIHGKTGFLVHERDAIGAANVLEILIKDEEMRRGFGRAGRERVLQMFDLEESMDRRLELFSRFGQLE